MSSHTGCSCYWGPPHLCPVHCDSKNELTQLRAQLEQVTKERDAWIEDAKRFCRNESFYYDELMKVASLLGKEVYISDDGSVQQDPLVLKIYDLVKEQRDEARAQRDRAMSFIRHKVMCNFYDTNGDRECDCGYREVMEEIAKEKESK